MLLHFVVSPAHVLTCSRVTSDRRVCMLLQGLAKLQKTQKDVDVLVEEAKIKAVEVEKKVAGADAFAEQVRELCILGHAVD